MLDFIKRYMRYIKPYLGTLIHYCYFIIYNIINFNNPLLKYVLIGMTIVIICMQTNILFHLLQGKRTNPQVLLYRAFYISFCFSIYSYTFIIIQVIMSIIYL